jgi:hypothetical protein
MRQLALENANYYYAVTAQIIGGLGEKDSQKT